MVSQDKNIAENKKDLARALNIFGEISTWVIVPIVLALIAGKYLDGRFDTKPWIFFALTGVAFIVSIFGIGKILIKYIKEIEKEAKEKKDGGNNSGTK